MTQLRTQLTKDRHRRRYIRVILLMHLRDLHRHSAKARTSLVLRRTPKDWDLDIVACPNPDPETTSGLAGMQRYFYTSFPLKRTESAGQREHDL